MALGMFLFLTDLLLKIMGGNIEEEMSHWYPTTNDKSKECLQSKRLDVAKLVSGSGNREAVQEFLQEEIKTHGTEGEALNHLSVIYI